MHRRDRGPRSIRLGLGAVAVGVRRRRDVGARLADRETAALAVPRVGFRRGLLALRDLGADALLVALLVGLGLLVAEDIAGRFGGRVLPKEEGAALEQGLGNRILADAVDGLRLVGLVARDGAFGGRDGALDIEQATDARGDDLVDR